MKNNNRSYGNDESILVYETTTTTKNGVSEMFDSLNVIYKRSKFVYNETSGVFRIKKI